MFDVSDEVKERYKELLGKIVKLYASRFNPSQIDETLEKFAQVATTNNQLDKYHVTYKQILNDIQEFMLPKEIGTIPIITTNDSGKWVAEYFIPERKTRVGNREKNEGWKKEVFGKVIKYEERALDATNMNKVLFGPNIKDNFVIINMWNESGRKNLQLNKEQLKHLIHNTGLGLVLLDGSHVAIVPYKFVADKSAQTFYSFEFETNVINGDVFDELHSNYKEAITRLFTQHLKFKPPWEELRLTQPRAYVDYSVEGKYPIELVNTGFTLPTSIFFTYHWTKVIKPYINPDWVKNPPMSAGLHINATIRTTSDLLLNNYLYGLRLFDTLLFRPGKRRQSQLHLKRVMGGRGLFRWEGANRLEVRYGQPRLDAGYLTNQLILTSKYVSDINKLAGVSLSDFALEDWLYPAIKKADALSLTKEYFNFYTDHILHLTPAEKQIFIEHTKYCLKR